MVQLRDLPTELVLHAASYVDNNADLCNLALTCRQLLPIAQEFLYSSVVLNNVEATDKEIPSFTLRFLRTVLQRPPLAKIVKCLDMTYGERFFINEIFVHKRSDPKHLQCMCSHTSLRQMIRDVFPDKPTADSAWILEANNAWEPALVGIILVKLTGLRALRLNCVTKQDSWGHDLGRPLRKHVNLKSLFGHTTRSCHGELTKALRRLKELEFSETSSWDFTVLPSVKQLTLGLTFPHSHHDPVTRPGVPLPQSTASLASVTSLISNCDLTILSTNTPEDDVMTAYLQDLLSVLTCLRKLVIRLEEPKVHHNDYEHDDLRETGYFSWGDPHYNNLFRHLLPASKRIETLIIDNAPIMKRWQAEHDLFFLGGTGIFNYLKRAQQVDSLTEFTKLRRLVVPRRAIFKHSKSEDDDDTTTTLNLSSASLKTLEILSAGPHTAECLQDSIPTFKSSCLPELEEIILHRAAPLEPLNVDDIDSELQSVGVTLKLGLVEDDFTLVE
jgi:hypothetical protein